MNGPQDEVGSPLVKGDTVVLCFNGNHYAAQIIEIHEPGLIAAGGPLPPAGRQGQVRGMEMAGTVTLAMLPITIIFSKQNPRIKALKITPPKQPQGGTA